MQVTTTSAPPMHLDPSELGNKEYWDNAYEVELTNHASDPSDTGHVWFDESDAEGRVSLFLERLAEDGEDDDEDPQASLAEDGRAVVLSKSSTSFLDLGTGNGSMLRALRSEGWRGEMLGVDYSEASIRLARRIEEEQEGEDETEGNDDGDQGQSSSADEPASAIRFETWDLIEGEYKAKVWASKSSTSSLQASTAISTTTAPPDHSKDHSTQTKEEENRDGERRPEPTPGCAPWDVVLDKGTFDAISLSSQVDRRRGRRIVEAYRDRVRPLVKRKTGLLVVTSCNWTEEELVQWFVGGDGDGDGKEVGEGEEGEKVGRGGKGDRLEELGRVTYPSFTFGGVKGQAISTVCFRRT